jgi:RNA polymerase sigma-70 factor (ECF subfamily)
MEAEILALIRASDARGATSELLKLYGAEVYGYTRSLLKDDDAADEAFAQASENVLLGISAFRGECSVRTWFYVIARHSALQELKRGARRRAERISLWEENLAAPVRTATLGYRSTQIKDRVAELRASLSAEERELLVLRVDRKLSWDEIALVCAEQDAPAIEGSDLKKAAARHRKQFERVKEKLRELARAAGLL